MATSRLPACTKCGFELPENFLNAQSLCPACQSNLRIVTFPALFRDAATGAAAQIVVSEGEAACFYHPEKRALVPCDICGRFLCALCDVELDGHHYCSKCLEAGGQKSDQTAPMERSRARHDQVVWTLLVVPMLTCGFLIPLTAIAALAVVFVGWRKPPSLVVNTKLWLTVGGILAALQLAAGVVFWWIIVSADA